MKRTMGTQLEEEDQECLLKGGRISQFLKDLEGFKGERWVGTERKMALLGWETNCFLVFLSFS